MRAVIQAAIGKALLVLEEPMGDICDDSAVHDSAVHDSAVHDSAVHDPGRPSGVVGGTAAPPKIHGTPRPRGTTGEAHR
jgi:hypothetical protein